MRQNGHSDLWFKHLSAKPSESVVVRRPPMKQNLWSVIHALSPGERAAVKKFLQRHVIAGTSDTSALFDAVASMDEYDEAALRRRCKGARFLSRLPAAKNELLALVMRAMRAHHHNKTTLHTITSLLQDAQFLLSRGLLHAATDAITSLERVTKEANDPALRMKALTLYAQYLRLKNEWSEQSIEWLGREMADAAQAAQEMATIEPLSTQVSLAIATNNTLPAQAQKNINTLMNSEGPLHPWPSVSIAQYTMAVSYALFYEKGANTAYEFELRIRNVFNTNAAYTKWTPQSNIFSIASAAQMAVLVSRFDESREYVSQAWTALNEASRTIPERVRLNLEIRLINTTIHRMLTEDAGPIPQTELKELLQRISENQLRGQTAEGMVALVNIALIALSSGGAADVLNIAKDLGRYPQTIRPDTRLNMAMLEIMAHYELGHMQLVASRARSVRRSLLKASNLHEDEDIFLRTLLNLAEAPSPAKRRKLITDAITGIEGYRERSNSRPRTDPYGPALWFRRLLSRPGKA